MNIIRKMIEMETPHSYSALVLDCCVKLFHFIRNTLHRISFSIDILWPIGVSNEQKRTNIFLYKAVFSPAYERKPINEKKKRGCVHMHYKHIKKLGNKKTATATERTKI